MKRRGKAVPASRSLFQVPHSILQIVILAEGLIANPNQAFTKKAMSSAYQMSRFAKPWTSGKWRHLRAKVRPRGKQPRGALGLTRTCLARCTWDSEDEPSRIHLGEELKY